MTTPTAFDHLAPFGALIGTWNLDAHTSAHWEGSISGSATFEWTEGQAFVTEHVRLPEPFPIGFYVIGAREDGDHPDSGTGVTLAQYFDARNVSRVFKTTLEDGTWKLWRDAPGFDQRFHAELSSDGSRMTGAWEMRNDDDWFVDFHLDYRRTD